MRELNGVTESKVLVSGSLLQGLLCVTVCKLLAVSLNRLQKVPNLVDTMRNKYVYSLS